MTDVLDFKAGPLTFDQWLEHVDREVLRIVGLGWEDLADWGYADAFSDGMEPEEAAHGVIADQAGGRDLLDTLGIEPPL